MLEKFSDGAINAMNLANQEAQRFKHEHLGTEHVLLGLLKEGGLNSGVLKGLDIRLQTARAKVEELVKPREYGIQTGRPPQTPRTKKIIELAIEFARGQGANFVGVEHMLYGVLAEEDGVGAIVLNQLGLTKKVYLERFREFYKPQEETASTSAQPDQTHWRIPRDKMSIQGVIKTYGFRTELVSTSAEKPRIDVFGRQTNEGRCIGRIEFEDEERKIYCEATVNYHSSDVAEAFAFRQALEDQGITDYHEEPPREVVAEELRRNAKETSSLADRIEGK